ncbi:MAG: TVP38/TMEM64 family protein [Proteobacteria bacterium]|nr:TVP38/TMEM64 family protein [Pseudomonadota bacterium]
MRPRKRFSPWRLVPVVVLLAGLVVAYAFGLTRYLSLDALRENRELLLGLLERNWPAAALLYIAVYAAAIAFSLPGGVFLTIVGGFMFGPYWGTLLVVVAATAGATALFLAARYLLGDALRERAGPALQRMEAGFRDNAVSYMFVLRLVPLFPFWLVNLVPACLGVPLGTYVFTTFFGIMPGSFVYASVGDGLGAILEVGGAPDTGAIFRPRFLVPILGLVALALLPVAYKWFRGRGRAD